MDLGRYMSPHYEALSWMLDGDSPKPTTSSPGPTTPRRATGRLDPRRESLIAAERKQWVAVESMLGRAVEIVESGHLDGYSSSALIFAAAARAAAHRGEMRQARQLVQRAAGLRPLLIYAFQCRHSRH